MLFLEFSIGFDWVQMVWFIYKSLFTETIDSSNAKCVDNVRVNASNSLSDHKFKINFDWGMYHCKNK